MFKASDYFFVFVSRRLYCACLLIFILQSFLYQFVLRGKDLLSAVNMKSFTQSNKQRSNTATDQRTKPFSGHQMHPSTSYEQSRSTYDTINTSVSVAYGSSYQVAQYPSSQAVLQRGAYDSRSVEQVMSLLFGFSFLFLFGTEKYHCEAHVLLLQSQQL